MEGRERVEREGMARERNIFAAVIRRRERSKEVG
jgi:hypothetical protein